MIKIFFIFDLFQAFVATGFNLLLNYDTSTNFNPAHRQCDFDREPGKVSQDYFILEDLVVQNIKYGALMF